jgi:DNA-binding NarL/FixJ family response regulator
VADDHPLFADALRRLLSRSCTVVAVVQDGGAVPEVAARSQADLVTLDLAMPNLSGMGLVRKTRQASKSSRILVINGAASNRLAAASLAEGADGFLSKAVAVEQYSKAVRTVLSGRQFVCLDRYGGSASEREDSRNPAVSRLTPRQRQVLALIGTGKKAPEIARQLGISERTAETHRAELVKRLGVQNLAQLYEAAIEYAKAVDEA